MTVGHRLVIRIVKNDAVAVPPTALNATSANGNHTRGETGRSIWEIGLRSRYTIGLDPINTPNGMAMADPIPKPIATRCNDAQSWTPMPSELRSGLNGSDSISTNVP